MLKKLLAVCLILCLLPLAGALADEPKPIVPLSMDQIEKTPEGMHHYLLLCSDMWEGASEKAPRNTDGIMLVTVDTMARRVLLTSVIRDLLVLRPDGVPGRINGIAKRFSLEELMTVLNTHFGLRIEKYVLVDWSCVENIIDAAGGVDITVTNGEAIRLKDKTAYKSDWAQPELRGAGTYHFRGYPAVIYMRIRSSGLVDQENYDFRRTTRARSVVSALADSLRELSYAEALQLMNSVMENIIATNLTMAEMVEAVGCAYELRDAQIEQLRLPIDGTTEELIYSGMATQQIDYEANREALRQFMFENFVVRDDAEED